MYSGSCFKGDRLTLRVSFQISASLLAAHMASIAIIDVANSGLVYGSLLLCAIFLMISIYAGCSLEDRVEYGNIDFV